MKTFPSTANPPPASYQVIGLDDLRYPQVREGLAYWQSLRGTRAFPSREQISPRAIARILTNTILIRVIGDGDDFEYVIVGDEVLRAYRVPLIHRRLSELTADLPNSTAYWGKVYRDICANKKPWAVRYGAGLDGEAKFSDAEAVLLPLGPTDDIVDHIMTFGKRTRFGDGRPQRSSL